jgi:hypothetical protein
MYITEVIGIIYWHYHRQFVRNKSTRTHKKAYSTIEYFIFPLLQTKHLYPVEQNSTLERKHLILTVGCKGDGWYFLCIIMMYLLNPTVSVEDDYSSYGKKPDDLNNIVPFEPHLW